MTALRQIFAKPVDRPIDGVIKADDEASLRTELEEYVITSEISQRLEQFLDSRLHCVPRHDIVQGLKKRLIRSSIDQRYIIL